MTIFPDAETNTREKQNRPSGLRWTNGQRERTMNSSSANLPPSYGIAKISAGSETFRSLKSVNSCDSV